MMENRENQPSAAANFNGDGSDSEFSGWNSDSIGSDISVNSDVSDVSNVSMVSSVRTNDLSDWESDRESDEFSENEMEIPQFWSVNDRTPILKRAFRGPEPGATSIMDPDANELDFFHLFFPKHLVEAVVRQTNLYARQKIAVKPDPNWVEVTERELLAWFGIRVYMSILQLPVTAMYWSKDSLFGNLNIRRVMKRDRFDKISQYLHVNDRRQNIEKGQPGHDKLFLVRPVLSEVTK